jgi:arginine decarboxylase
MSKMAKQVGWLVIVCCLLLAGGQALAGQMVLGNRIPRDYFITVGTGESSVGVHTGSYDAALQMAGIENCNIIAYSSVMPPEARQVKHPGKLHHGSVMETIMADMSGNQGELITAGLITWKVYDKKQKKIIGGFVAEYHGHAIEETAKENLFAAQKGMNERRGYGKDHYEIKDTLVIVKSLVPKKEYGTVIVAIGFLNYIYPVVPK